MGKPVRKTAQIKDGRVVGVRNTKSKPGLAAKLADKLMTKKGK
jgi:hypothetical protein